MLNSFVYENNKQKCWSESKIQEHNTGVINNIKQHNDKKINLFIGKNPHEALPEKKNDEIWVSLSYDALKENLQNISVDRLHLIIDCNFTPQMQSIKNLFFSVVVDFSTRKFMNNEGLSNIYNSVQKDGSLFIELDIEGGGKNINERVAELKFEYDEKFKDFVVNLFQEKFQVSIDMEQFEGNICYHPQIENCKESIYELEEYKDWKKNQKIEDDFEEEMYHLFKYLLANEGVVDPVSAHIEEINQKERKTRTDEMFQNFETVDFLNQDHPYPYRNSYNHNGYFHAKGKNS